MGSEVIKAVNQANDLELVASIDQNDSFDLVKNSGSSVAVDFTTPDSVIKNIELLITSGISPIVGTTGIDDKKLEIIRKLSLDHGNIPVRVVPNFSVGAILMMRFAKMATKFYDSVEIIEYHHAQKVDSPSGTAVRTAKLIAQERKENNLKENPDATISEIPGSRGSKIDGIPVHAVRMQGLVAHQEVILDRKSTRLNSSHTDISRMPSSA